MKQLEKYHSDDYAGLVSGKYKFYYGYEVTNKNEEWCFTVKEHGNLILTLSSSEIEYKIKSDQLYNPVDYLLAGIGIWLLLQS